MGRGETEQTCEWDIAGGELGALEGFLRAMLAFEPAGRPIADQLLGSEYMVKWSFLRGRGRKAETELTLQTRKSIRLSAPK